jgi:hypothetical protein
MCLGLLVSSANEGFFDCARLTPRFAQDDKLQGGCQDWKLTDD